jgi:hypothetical protein
MSLNKTLNWISMKNSYISFAFTSLTLALLVSQASLAADLATLSLTGTDGKKLSLKLNSQLSVTEKSESDGRKFNVVVWRADGDVAKSAGLNSAVVQVNALSTDGKVASIMLVAQTATEQKNYTSLCEHRAKPACDAAANGVTYDAKGKKVVLKDAKLVRAQKGKRDATDTLTISGEIKVQ